MCFFFNDTATTEIYTLSLHDALPISPQRARGARHAVHPRGAARRAALPAVLALLPGLRLVLGRVGLAVAQQPADPKSTRLNSSHANIPYAVFCLEKKRTGAVVEWILR